MSILGAAPNLANLLKEVYSPEIIGETILNHMPVVNMLVNKGGRGMADGLTAADLAEAFSLPDQVFGNEYYMPIFYGYPDAIYNRPNTSAGEVMVARTPHDPFYKPAKWTPFTLDLNVEFTRTEILKSQNPTQAFNTEIRNKLTRTIESRLVDLETQAVGANGTGVRGTISAHAGTDFTVSDANGLQRGWTIDVWDELAGPPAVNVGQCRITAKYIKSDGTRHIIVDADPGVANGNTFYLWGNRKLEIVGFAGLADPTIAVGGIDPTVAGNEFWKGCVDINAGSALTQTILDKAFTIMRYFGYEPDFIVTTPQAETGYFESFASNVRYIQEDEPVYINGGYQRISHAGVPIIADNKCPKGTAFLGVKRFLKLVSESPGGRFMWVTNGGQLVGKGGPYSSEPELYLFIDAANNRQLHRATGSLDLALITENREGFGRITNITE